ncbi:hypothetical protein GCM10011452_34960 [Gemmobacter lanyuensis]|uniref:Cobalt chelatase n=2 Tax=Gemmobacter lanyuensis TaxID=1054497 RepID=A0A918MQ86_9RHOB|nr:hypothetical protein GCM10011452_34960 [Gemmobacter lanyuensis]
MTMDYSKSGSVAGAKKAPKRHQELNQKGGAKNPFGSKDDKAALLARMKAAAEAKKQD